VLKSKVVTVDEVLHGLDLRLDYGGAKWIRYVERLFILRFLFGRLGYFVELCLIILSASGDSLAFLG
jgi:hypothetical protein